MKRLRYIQFICVILFVVIGWQIVDNIISGEASPVSLEAALQSAGKNRSELEKVLRRYQKHSNDSLKYRAACFLIKNMPFYGFYEGEELCKYLRYFEVYSMNKKPAQEVVDSIKKADGEFERQKLTYRRDIETVDSIFLVNHIEWAFKVWQEQPWGKNVVFHDFCEYILPYRIGNEPLSLWRKELYEKYNPMLTDFRSSIDATNPMRAAQILLDDLRSWNYRYTGLFPQGPHIGPVTLQWNSGSCREFSDGIVYMLRSVGIPCGIDKVLQRGDANSTHFWNFTLDHNRQSYTVELPYKMKWSFASEHILPKGKTYRETFGLNEKMIRELANVSCLWPTFKLPFFEDVTHEYAGEKMRTISFAKKRLNTSLDENDLVYLCLANRQEWCPVDFAFIEQDTICFDRVEGGVIGILATWNGKTLTSVTDPFLIDKESDELHFFAAEENTCMITLYEKYHLASSSLFQYMLDGVIEGSNRKDFKDADTLYHIQEVPYRLYTIAELKSEKAYRYVRYRGRDGSRCGIAELVFYENVVDTLPLRGKTIGTSVIPGGNIRNEYTNVFDGNPNTSFNYKKLNGGWAGLDLGRRYRVRKVVYTPRNEINFIYKGDTYELFYWKEKRWNSLGRQIAVADSLNYSTPRNALLYLRNHSHGKDERIFEYRDGKQIFW